MDVIAKPIEPGSSARGRYLFLDQPNHEAVMLLAILATASGYLCPDDGLVAVVSHDHLTTVLNGR